MTYYYIGSELELFREAHLWKDYYRSFVAPHLGPRVLEVGAGLGGTTQHLCYRDHQRWVCLEPDTVLAGEIERLRGQGQLPAFCAIQVGTVADLPANDLYDSILYIDVLEHIADDRAEMDRAAAHLLPHGKLIVLAPAHNWLFSPFDAAIGHYRRYDRWLMQEAAPPGLECVALRYLDSVGLLASLGNRLFLRRSMPSLKQIHFWDRRLVPSSRFVDWLLRYRLGKSILGIWRKPALAGVSPERRVA